MTHFGFGPARAGETIVHGAQRHGYSSKRVGAAQIEEWIAFMKGNGIRRVCCLLPPGQLEYYQVDLLDQYRAAFGKANVCAVRVEDYHLCDGQALELEVLPFLLESDRPTHGWPYIAPAEADGRATSWRHGSFATGVYVSIRHWRRYSPPEGIRVRQWIAGRRQRQNFGSFLWARPRSVSSNFALERPSVVRARLSAPPAA